MAAKRPIIASRVGGVPEVIVDGESGVLVMPGDAAGLYQEMRGLLASETRRTALAASAFERVCTRFSEHAMATTYRSLYRVNTAAPLWKKAAKEWMRRLLPRQWLMWSGGPHRPEVAITFDDGPDAVYTPRILDLLERYGAKATFFLIGEKVCRNAALVQRMIHEGHEIANHSFSHPHFERLSWRRAALEVRRAQAIVSSLQDQRCKLFRPPRGKLCWRSLLSAWFEAMTIVMWSVDLKDFSAANAQEIRSAVDARRLAPGDIVLYHGQTAAALEALPYLLEFTMRSGYRAVRVSELLRA
jgi:peptidoglycan/xylan/chitin deacetylase (PgdA/CDA1 family)